MNIEQFIHLLSDLTNIPTEHITEESQFRDDLGIDSLNMVNLFVQLAEKTGVGFESFISGEDILSVGSVYRIIEKGIAK